MCDKLQKSKYLLLKQTTAKAENSLPVHVKQDFCGEHIEAVTKCPPFHRQPFQMQFLE